MNLNLQQNLSNGINKFIIKVLFGECKKQNGGGGGIVPVSKGVHVILPLWSQNSYHMFNGE